jgi:hypothetical protein
MPIRADYPFRTIDSTAPSFVATSSTASAAFALEATGVREWFGGPGSRAVRLASITADDYHVGFGTSDLVIASTTTPAILGGTVEIFSPIKPGYTHIAVISSSTDIDVNVTLGYGQ